MPPFGTSRLKYPICHDNCWDDGAVNKQVDSVPNSGFGGDIVTPITTISVKLLHDNCWDDGAVNKQVDSVPNLGFGENIVTSITTISVVLFHDNCWDDGAVNKQVRTKFGVRRKHLHVNYHDQCRIIP